MIGQSESAQKKTGTSPHITGCIAGIIDTVTPPHSPSLANRHFIRDSEPFSDARGVVSYPSFTASATGSELWVAHDSFTKPTMPNIRYADHARFPSDTLEGETVLIDTMKGSLFLFTGLAPQIWHCFTTGNTANGVVTEMVGRYGLSAAAPTQSFIDALEAAQMLRDKASAHGTEDASIEDWPAVFLEPILERYDDIADIIAMDPIHEVDRVQGWPRRD